MYIGITPKSEEKLMVMAACVATPQLALAVRMRDECMDGGDGCRMQLHCAAILIGI